MTSQEFFQRYDIDLNLGRLGGGAFGTVYKAYDTILDAWKAIKIAEVKYVKDKTFSLIDEYKATKDLPDHKNIANYEAVYQFQERNGLYDYAVMQYYPEGNLSSLMRSKAIPLDQKIKISKGLIEGVNFLHENKVLHRDLKPSNILVSLRKSEYIPKIADFGLAKSLDMANMTSFTNSFVGGTLEYSSPEQVLGNKMRYNADLWSMAVIIYELFVGNIPFESEGISGNSEAKRRNIYQGIVNSPVPDNVKQCPHPFDKVIIDCLVKDQDKRVQSAAELLTKYFSEDQVEEIPKPTPGRSEAKTQIFHAQPTSNEKASEPSSKTSLYSEQVPSNQESPKDKLEKPSEVESDGELPSIGSQIVDNTDPKTQISEARSKPDELPSQAKGHSQSSDISESDAPSFYKGVSQVDDIKPIDSYESNYKSKPEIQTPISKTVSHSQISEQLPESTEKKIDKKLLLMIPLLIGLIGIAVWGRKMFSSKASPVIEIVETPAPKGLSELRQDLENTSDPTEIVKLEELIKSMEAAKDSTGWQLALDEHSVSGYESYINNFPNGQFIEEANNGIDNVLEEMKNLSENERWKRAQKLDSEGAYKDFILDFPKSSFVPDAKKALKKFANNKELDVWKSALNQNYISAYEDYLSQFPNGKYKKKAQEKIKALENKRSENNTSANNNSNQNTSNTSSSIPASNPSSSTTSTSGQSAWRSISASNDMSRIQEFIKNNPNSRFTNEAKLKMQQLDWDVCKKINTAQTYRDFAAKYPKGRFVSEAKSLMKKMTAPAIIKLIDNQAKIPSGVFTYGCGTGKNCEKDELPAQSQSMSSFRINKFEVTQSFYQSIMGKNPSHFNGNPQYPVDNVSWYDAQEFIKKLNSMPSNPYQFRLPTEKEWEYAAGGGENFIYSGGDKIKDVAHYKGNSNGTKTVGSKKPNKYGIYDMSGNVAEWCQDSYAEDSYKNKNPKESKMKVIRGGSYLDRSKNCRVNSRFSEEASTKNETIGFRLVQIF